jgi:hypothetical protein
VFLAIAIGMILVAVVRMSEQPPWLVLCLAIFGPTGSIAVLFSVYLRYLTRRIGQLNRQIDESQLDSANNEKK